MNSDECVHWLERYGAAWVERDPEAAAALFTPMATYHETPFDPAFVGRDAIREYWSEVPRSQKDISFASRLLSYAGTTGIAQWRATFVRVPDGPRVELNGILVLEFDDSGACRELREWWHRRDG